MALLPMMPNVQEDVGKCIADCLRARKRPHVIAPIQNAPSPIKGPMSRPGQARPDSLHAARQGVLIRSFDDPMYVIVLNRVRHDAKVRTPPHFPEAARKRPKEPLETQRRHIIHHPNRDVRGMPLQNFVPLDVMDDGPFGGRPSRSGPRPTAPSLHSNVVECELSRFFHGKIMAHFVIQVK